MGSDGPALGLGSLLGFLFGAGLRACGYHTVIDETGCVLGPQLEYSAVVIARGQHDSF